MNTWNIDYPDTASCQILSEGRTPDHTISCSTGETADSNARYHGARAMHLALVTLDATADRWAGRGEDFRELIVPSAIKATHKNHIRTFVRRALQSATGAGASRLSLMGRAFFTLWRRVGDSCRRLRPVSTRRVDQRMMIQA